MQMLDIVAGGVLIALYGYDRFNTPPTNRSSTTAARYHSAAIFYCLATLLLYAFLLRFPVLVQQAVAAAGQSGDGIAGLVPHLPKPLLVALLLTVLLPKVPVLSSGDEWIRKKLQYMAAIPYEVRRMSAELRRSRFAVADSRRQAVHGALLADGFDARDIVFGPGETAQHLWTRTAVLMTALEEWESQPRFAGFLATFATDAAALKKHYRQMGRKARECFRLVREHASDNGGAGFPAGVQQYYDDFTEQAADLFSTFCDFVSRAVLQCELTHAKRHHQLEALGFDCRISKPRLSLHQLAAVFTGVTVAFIVTFAVVRGDSDRITPELFLRAVMIATTYVSAIVAAVYPKERWRFAKRQPAGFRPIAFYLAAGLVAAAAGGAITFGFKLLAFADFVKAARASAESMPWAVMTFVTAFVTAWLADDVPGGALPPPRLRWIEGLGQAAVTLATGWFVHLLLVQTSRTVPPLGVVLGLSVLIGFGIGFFVPTWYRTAPADAAGAVDEVLMPQPV